MFIIFAIFLIFGIWLQLALENTLAAAYVIAMTLALIYDHYFNIIK